MNKENLNKKVDLMKKLQAFSLFRNKGMKAVESSFPEYKKFVESNKEKSLREVKQELTLMAQSAH